MALTGVLDKVVGWLRAGYPEGVPETDYIPLFALLGRRLTDAEVRQIADDLAAAGDERSREAIGAAIERVKHETPQDEDIRRVRSHLALGGWPLAAFSEEDPFMSNGR